MKFKKLLPLFVALLTLCVSAQNKTFSYSKIQTRNEVQEWGEKETIQKQNVSFSADKINLNIDKKYCLTIISKTHLPDKSIIYLCKDEKSNPVTVTLIRNTKMYLYSKSKRFLINFDS
ncbi:hypothetical protein [Flavobacterium sp. GT3R68]|uniref:hypothetical protein n=1 Tax=Flavobacterium sp. GT3R68 TaxID=2594437 RepID=UPI000F89BD11|nr:hypothetical protein [Flavobacterium sp. GT3R68]RTY92384.1 hypothetical protein EKL32_17405 [Flavobacterium sp. GSN2]TRW92298.1 hypothetical protein FNW07_04620 [Flavobacterium sp. GT3R68]